VRQEKEAALPPQRLQQEEEPESIVFPFMELGRIHPVGKDDNALFAEFPASCR
jgi:hypothetical protein